MYKYCNGYYLCQRVNSVTQESVGTLKPLMIQVGPLTDISYNLIPGLPLSNRFDSILTAIEWLKKMVHFIPYKETMGFKRLANLILRHTWSFTEQKTLFMNAEVSSTC